MLNISYKFITCTYVYICYTYHIDAFLFKFKWTKYIVPRWRKANMGKIHSKSHIVIVKYPLF